MISSGVNENHVAHILLVEDDLDDVELTRRALTEHKLLLNLDVVGDGEEAMRYLRKLPPFENKRLPDLILLDLNLPKIDGREVLTQIRSDENLRSLPVVVLTTSSDDEDVIKAYNLHANCFITKPVGMKNFSTVVHKIEDFWFSVVRLPKVR
ncbi:MAG: response regulator [Rhodocyclaceae bacterium]|jgi:chemotaxis family two-component system response regulator Rcp1|nr:response regulator [Rhodocyclaceae bacterium]